ncbi:hypothetical protein Tco_0445115 [Tanacetum coccineum]
MLAPPVVVGEGSKQPTKPQPTSFIASQEIITQVATATALQPPKDSNTYRRTKRGRNTKVPQSRGSPKKVGDEAINEDMLDSVERAITTDASLDAAQDSDNITKTQSTATLNEPHPQREEGHTSRSGEGRMEHQFELTANVPITPHDSPLPGGYTPRSDEGRLKLQESMTICIQMSKQVLDLEKEKDAQAMEILRLNKRVKRLERQRKLSTTQLRRRKYRQVESSDDDLDEEDASKQGRKNDKTNPMLHESDFDGFDDETVDAATTGVKTASAPVTTAGVAISTAEPRHLSTTTTVFDRLKIKDQGLAQIKSDAELAHRLHEEELAEIERIQKEKAAQEEVSMAAIYEEYDTIQASIDADALFAAKLQQEDREQYTIKERAKFLAVTIAAQRKFRAAQRAAEIRRGYKMNYFKGMKYEDIRPIFEKVWDQNQSFVPMDSEDKEKGSKKKAGGSRKKTRARKRAGEKQSDQSAKRQKEKEELKAYLELAPREEFAMEIESLATKYPIVDWKTHVLTENFMYYQIIRADGGSKNYKIFSEMLDDFDKQDVMDLHRLVEERYATSRPKGYDLMLSGDLKILFQPDEEDEVWRHQHEYNLISWRLFDSCGIHILLMDNGIAIHMMIEKKYDNGKKRGFFQEYIFQVIWKRFKFKIRWRFRISIDSPLPCKLIEFQQRFFSSRDGFHFDGMEDFTTFIEKSIKIFFLGVFHHGIAVKDHLFSSNSKIELLLFDLNYCIGSVKNSGFEKFRRDIFGYKAIRHEHFANTKGRLNHYREKALFEITWNKKTSGVSKFWWNFVLKYRETFIAQESG